MSAREEILGRVRAALVGSAAAELPPRDYRRVITGAPETRVAQLADRLTDYRARVHLVNHEKTDERNPAEVFVELVAQVLAATRTLVVPADLPAEWLARYPGEVRRDHDPIPLADLDAPGVSVLTGCAVAIAETGTIVLDTGPTQGRRALTLVPDHHVCVVHTDQVVAGVPDGLVHLTDPTRPLTLISGPSATSDIELNRVEGVHGPRTLDVIITP